MSWELSQCVCSVSALMSCVCVRVQYLHCYQIPSTTPAGLVPRQTKEHSLVLPTLELCKVTRICTTAQIFPQTIPDVFQKHKTYPLPEEDKQIRRGGNGQIFATEYFGYSLVAKKTLFRNREYNIILRLNHANIVPLLALMVGEVSHRRRFYCYHMLPRMSGESACQMDPRFWCLHLAWGRHNIQGHTL